MRALVVYESLWGNTEKIAKTVAEVLAATMTVETVAADLAPNSVDGFDLLVVGGPTHAFSMTRESTRADAVKRGAPLADEGGIRGWLDRLAPPTTPIFEATFDTRTDVPRLPGSAAKAAEGELRGAGFTPAIERTSFHVNGYEGPLVDGEVERAKEWAGELAAAMKLTLKVV